MYTWVLCGLVGIIACEVAKRVKGEKIVIDGKKVVKYIFMLVGGVFTLFYAVYYMFTITPIVFDSEEPSDASSEDENP